MTEKVLVVRFSAFGDLVLTTGPLMQLREKFPSLEIDLLTSEIGDELFVNSPVVDNRIVVEKGVGFGDLIKHYRRLEQYDVVIDLQANFKSYFLKIFQKNAKFYHIEKHSRERRAFVKNRKYRDKLDQHVVEKYYKVLKKALPELPDLPVNDLGPRFVPPNITFDTLQFDIGNSIAIHPYASQKNKEWPYFSELCEKLLDENYSVMVIGQSESSITTPESDRILNLTNRTSLREMASLLRATKALITTDSGPMHLGISVQTPTLALFGPTTKEFGFYPRFSQTRVVEQDLDCRPCHIHGGNQCPLQHHNCMRQMSVEKVFSDLNLLLQK